MDYVSVGKSSLQISKLGFGTWGLGSWQPGQLSYGITDDKTSQQALLAALQAGINYYDTAALYGLGHAEKVLATAFTDKREQVIISTKCGYIDFSGEQCFTPDYIESSLTASLERLQSPYIDMLTLHDPSVTLFDDNPALEHLLQDLLKSNKARCLGVSAKSPADAMTFLQLPYIDYLIINFNMLDLRALSAGVLPLAKKNKVALIARTPLCFGFLTGTINSETLFPESDHRKRWPKEQINRWLTGARELINLIRDNEDCATESDSSIALRFCCSYPEISSVIPGMLSPREVEANLASAARPAFSSKTLQLVYEHYQNMSLYC